MRYTTLLNLLTVAKAGGCDQNPCLNNGQCYDIGENEYECICDSFAGKNCQIPPPSVTCDASRISVEIDRAWLLNKVGSDNHRHIYMGNGQHSNGGCLAHISEDNNSKLTVALNNNFRQCGTQIKRADNGDYVYSNTVYMSLQNAGVQTGLAAIVQWNCEYEDEYTVTYNGGMTAVRDDSAKARAIIGTFDLNLRAYSKSVFTTDNMMTSFVAPGSNKVFHVIPENKKWLSFQNSLTGEAQLRGTRVSLKKCFISYSRSPFSKIAETVPLVEEGCSTGGSTATHIYTNGQGPQASFATNIQKLRQPWMRKSPFYVHCTTRLCPSGEVCPVGCSQERSAPQGTIEGDELKIHVTSGPYFFQGSEALKEQTQMTANLEEKDAEHSSFSQIMGDTFEVVEVSDEEEILLDREEDLPLVGAVAVVSLLAILVVVGFVTIYQRRTAAAKEQPRMGPEINLHFAHEGSLRKTKAKHVVIEGRALPLPGPRPAGHNLRPNYV